ncbi:MAG: hypothetical protein DHS20C05_19700 [Hyphococcus sp.]|nr:MAG: hypothetical protein DHS20C05_19700 [Marinicaulis sp.]
MHYLIWVGLLCCLTALLIRVFPNAAFNMGIDIAAAWLVFGFGVFLIVISTLMSVTQSGGSNIK